MTVLPYLGESAILVLSRVAGLSRCGRAIASVNDGGWQALARGSALHS